MDFDVLKQQILKVNKAFYEHVYKDEWLALVFKDVEQKHIELQQTDFMVGAFGGPKIYSGRNPFNAHPHIFVNEEMWMLREKYLREALIETDFPKDLGEKWIKIDEAFKKAIIKNSYTDCEKRFTMDEIIYYPKRLNSNKKAA